MEDRHFFRKGKNTEKKLSLKVCLKMLSKKKQHGLICEEGLICGGLTWGEIQYFRNLDCKNIFVAH